MQVLHILAASICPEVDRFDSYLDVESWAHKRLNHLGRWTVSSVLRFQVLVLRLFCCLNLKLSSLVSSLQTLWWLKVMVLWSTIVSCFSLILILLTNIYFLKYIVRWWWLKCYSHSKSIHNVMNRQKKRKNPSGLLLSAVYYILSVIEAE